MRSRRRAREVALQALYQCDTLEDWSAECVQLYFDVFKPENGGEENAVLSSTEKENLEFAKSIIQGVLKNLEFIDEQITAASTNWSISRMCRVDRNILRFATFEMALVDEIPLSVSINEAIEIAKAYGTPDSPMFVNGVLDNIAGVLKRDPAMASKAQSARERQAKLAANS
ncbi:MAG: transcription antitermination factor NusB [Oligoflexia bacterium]|nr:transcription antitermination factor NusB [Oligoflexia bacterium]